MFTDIAFILTLIPILDLYWLLLYYWSLYVNTVHGTQSSSLCLKRDLCHNHPLKPATLCPPAWMTWPGYGSWISLYFSLSCFPKNKTLMWLNVSVTILNLWVSNYGGIGPWIERELCKSATSLNLMCEEEWEPWCKDHCPLYFCLFPHGYIYTVDPVWHREYSP